jgi:hypothetical protein
MMTAEEQMILELWNKEPLMPQAISLKLGIPQEIVESVVEYEGNYEEVEI